MTRVAFTAYGIPQSAGSKNAHALRRRDGSLVTRPDGSPIINVIDSNPKGKDWRVAVVAAMRGVYHGPLLDGPLSLAVVFRFPRPAAHYGSGRNAGLLRSSAPAYPAIAPDVTKLVRCLEDGLNGVLWKDDSRVIVQYALKVYGEPAGADVVVEDAPPGLAFATSRPATLPLFEEPAP